MRRYSGCTGILQATFLCLISDSWRPSGQLFLGYVSIVVDIDCSKDVTLVEEARVWGGVREAAKARGVVAVARASTLGAKQGKTANNVSQ